MMTETPEISSRLVKPILLYYRERYGSKAADNLLNEAGLSKADLENSSRISYELYNRLLLKFIQTTKNPNASFEAGSYLLQADSLGFILPLLKIFGSPLAVYKAFAQQSEELTRASRMTITEIGPTSISIRTEYISGFSQSKINCLTVQGQLAYIPCLWGLPPADIQEIHCAAENGHEGGACIYEIQWKPVRRYQTLLAAGMAVLLAVETAAVFLQTLNWLKWKELVISFLAMILIYELVRGRKYRKSIRDYRLAEIENSKELQESLGNIIADYRELLLANQQTSREMEKTTVLKEIAVQINKDLEEKQILENTASLILNRIGFDRAECLVLNRNFDLVREPVLLYHKPPPDHPVDGFKSLQALLKGAAALQNPVFQETRVIIPVLLENVLLYFMIFENFDQPINPDYRQFFITVSNLLETALNRLFASEASRSIISSIPSSIALFDRESKLITFYNDSFQREIAQRDILNGIFILDAIGIENQETRERLLKQMDELYSLDYLDDQELNIRGEVIGYTLFLMPEMPGRIKEVGIIMKIITSQKEMKEQLFRAEKMAALGTLVSGVAHEINNPLYGILGNAEIIRDESSEPEIREYAKSIVDFTIHASDIVKDLSSYSRSMRDEKPDWINLNGVMDEALKIVRYSKNFIHIQTEKDFTDIPELHALKGELQQVYINLLHNAVDAMKGIGTLKLSSRFSDGFIITSVEDSGSGIPPENIGKIFDPFFTTKETGMGTGLGLSIVYRLVTKYDGLISVRSNLGKGSIFDIKFKV